METCRNVPRPVSQYKNGYRAPNFTCAGNGVVSPAFSLEESASGSDFESRYLVRKLLILRSGNFHSDRLLNCATSWAKQRPPVLPICRAPYADSSDTASSTSVSFTINCDPYSYPLSNACRFRRREEDLIRRIMYLTSYYLYIILKG